MPCNRRRSGPCRGHNGHTSRQASAYVLPLDGGSIRALERGHPHWHSFQSFLAGMARSNPETAPTGRAPSWERLLLQSRVLVASSDRGETLGKCRPSYSDPSAVPSPAIVSSPSSPGRRPGKRNSSARCEILLSSLSPKQSQVIRSGQYHLHGSVRRRCEQRALTILNRHLGVGGLSESVEIKDQAVHDDRSDRGKKRRLARLHNLDCDPFVRANPNHSLAPRARSGLSSMPG